ncbi:MAG: ABC transporter ATP-binding protein [Alphaproteobacteria bacterium]|nr:ABC transporter ATP-binding protein [Alphaproteobacteria bacterium]
MTGQRDPILKIEGLTKSFHDVHVLMDINLSIEEGAFLVLVGPSGCGKSTLLNCVAGLEAQTSGRILIGGRDMTRVAPKDRDIAMVFQSYALYPNMSVARNITFGMKVRGATRAQQKSALEKVAGMLKIDHLLDRRPAQLSGGQRQRVAMGRALVRQPKLFLLDEPLSNLDAKLRVEMRAEIKRLHRALGATIVYVTHDQTEAMSLATEVAVMEGGVIAQLGPPQQVYDYPVNTFVAGFIGSPAMNFVDGRIRTDGGVVRIAVALDGAVQEFRADHYPFADGIEDGAEVVLGIRPEYVTGAGHSADEPGVALDLIPTLVETNGFDQHVNLALGDSDISGRFSPREQIRIGTPVRTRIDLSQMSVFDRRTRRRL